MTQQDPLADIGCTTALNPASSAQRRPARGHRGTWAPRYVDLAHYVNLVHQQPIGLRFVTPPPCTLGDATDGIGIGVGKVNSALCTTSTLLAAMPTRTSTCLQTRCT